MYQVEIVNDDIKTLIHGPKTSLASGKVTKGINTIDTFTFTMLPDNPGFGLINEFTTHVQVYNPDKEFDRRWAFHGRVLYAETTMDDSGLVTKTVTCESMLGYLCDSVQTYVDAKKWTVEELLGHLIDCHNSQVEDYKKFRLGNITVTDENDSLYVGIGRDNTWDSIKSNLIDKLGGEIQFRYDLTQIFIDYLVQIGEEKETEIALSVNMKSITKEQDPTSYVTRLIPLGCKLKNESGEETEHRLDITDVPGLGGVNYIDDLDGIETYGIHVGVVIFDDVTTSSLLAIRGHAWISSRKVNVKYTINYLDLYLLGLVADDFYIGNIHPVKNHLIGVLDRARIIKQTIDVCDETQSTIEVGDSFKTLSDIQREHREQIKQAANSANQARTEAANIVNTVNKDVELKLDEMKQAVTEQETSVLGTCELILLTALESYVKTSKYEEFKATLKAELAVWADAISGSVTATERNIQTLNDDLQTKFNTITKYFTFNIDGLTVGQVDNPNQIVIDNDEITIYAHGRQVQTFKADGTALVPIMKITDALNVVGLQITADETHINCDFVG